MTQVVELKFDLSNGKTTTLSVDAPKENLTPAEVQAAMQQIIDSNVFHNNGSSFVSINSARIVERTTSELISK